MDTHKMIKLKAFFSFLEEWSNLKNSKPSIVLDIRTKVTGGKKRSSVCLVCALSRRTFNKKGAKLNRNELTKELWLSLEVNS